MSAALNESDAASGGTDPRHGPNNFPEGSVMDVSEHIIALAGPASEPWSDDQLAMLVGIPLVAEPTEAELSRDHPLFEVEGFDVWKRPRDADGHPIGSYVIERQEWIIRRRDPDSVGALLASHRSLVKAHEDLFSEGGEPLVPEEEIAACYGREQAGLRSLLTAPCRTLHDASLKAAYLRDNFDLGDLALQGEFEAFLGSLIVERRA